MQECASYVYEEEIKRCTVYSVFMRDSKTEGIGTYYKRIDAEEYIAGIIFILPNRQFVIQIENQFTLGVYENM